MPHVISDACIDCGQCEGECPVNAIAEKGGKRAIDAGTCIDCDQCTSVCPVNAISQG